MTLTHETVRSDHIAVLMEIEGGESEDFEEVEKYRVHKTDWEKWDTTTSSAFSKWLSEIQMNSNMETLYDSFLAVFETCMKECTPKANVKISNRRKIPAWSNEKVKDKKTKLNRAKKSFKDKKTPFNLSVLKDCEADYDTECEKAKEEWVNSTCIKIDHCKNPKDKWQAFKKLTSYRDTNTSKVLPLYNERKEIVFDHVEKSSILQKTFFDGGHIAEESFDETFKEEIECRLKSIREEMSSQEGDGFLNRQISYDEVEAAIQRLSIGKAPGPDQIYTDMLINSNETLKEAITILFQKSLSEGQLPQLWKTANVKFLMKPGKDSYYQASSYRPISLTSVLGKCLERVIHARLYAFAEHHELLDKEQDGFRQYRGTTQSLLRLTQDILNGFNESKATLATFIDMEKAFDSVWRDGLLVKLFDKGINGKIWEWIYDFLKDRKASCLLHTKHSESFETNIGLPQGSVLSPLLFNVFLCDIYDQVTSEKVKFADDGTIWSTGYDPEELAKTASRGLDSIAAWTHKWRMKIHALKTESCLFTKDEYLPDPSVKMNGKNISKTVNPKVLGVILDKKDISAAYRGSGKESYTSIGNTYCRWQN